MIDHDEERERRIQDEAIVDAYGSEEHIIFPLKTRCLYSHKTSPLKVGEVVKVLEMAGEDDCTSDMIVIIQFQDHTVGVPLAQLEPIADDEGTVEAIKDWHYWVGRGHTF